MEQERLKYLYRRYLNDCCSAEELEEFQLFVNNPDYSKELRQLLDVTWKEVENEQPSDLSEARADSVFAQIVARKQKHRRVFWRNVAAAAMITLTLGSAFYFYRESSVTGLKETISQSKSDILPGGNNAILTLANGSQIELSKAGNGKVSSLKNGDIQKVAEGLVIHSGPEQDVTELIQYNTLTVPRGGHYQVTLPDGSKVWLNSQSVLRFPVSFTGKERSIEMLGEAYFEIASDPHKPFKVKVNNMQVTVLGTHFNIRAYEDERKVRTTLLEGSVQLENSSEKALLVPGQQAVVSDAKSQITISEVDPDAAIGWKNGYFHFSRHRIHDIMSEVARWYDVKVIYKGEISQDEFVGKIRRSVTLSQALNMLSTLSNFNFTVEGRTIIVSEKNELNQLPMEK